MILYPPSALDGNQVLQHAFDEATSTLRTTAILNPGGTSEVIISHTDDSIRLGDGVKLVTTTTVSGKIGLDVNIINAAFPTSLGQKTMANSFPVVIASDQSPLPITLSAPGTVDFIYDEISGIASASETTVATYMVGVPQAYLLFAKASGTNIADYKVKINGTVVDRQYTYFGGSLSVYFDFKSPAYSYPGLSLVSGDIVTVTVIHSRPNLGDFNANIEVFES